jgi:hypothetical protein
MNKKAGQALILVILLISVGIFQYLYWSIPDEFGEETYEFKLQIQPSPEFNLYSVLIYYDFLNKEGNISFGVSSGTKPHCLGFTTPCNLTITNIIIKDNSNFELKEGVDFIRENRSYNLTNRVDLDNFKRSIEDCKVLIEFEGELSPNANYEIEFDVGRAQTQVGEFIIFNIGDYYCPKADFCLSSEWDRVNRYYYSESGKERAVARIDEKGGGVDPTVERFRLRLEQSRTLLEKKQDWKQWEFLFLAVLIATFISMVASILTKNGSEKGKRK